MYKPSDILLNELVSLIESTDIIAAMYMSKAVWALDAESCGTINREYLYRIQNCIENPLKDELSAQERRAIVINLFFCPKQYLSGKIMAFVDTCAKRDVVDMIKTSAQSLISNYEQS